MTIIWADFTMPPINLWHYPKQFKDYAMINEETNVKPQWILKEARNVNDPINQPSHYTHGGIEVIDYIEAKGFDTNWNLANVIKYVSRAGYKANKIEDLKKAQFYLAREIKKLETNI
jgi:hypothetical protein